MNKNIDSNVERLILIYSKYSAPSVGFEEKINKYITGKICIDNSWSRTRILNCGQITKVPSLVYINSAGIRTILHGIDECAQVLENASEDVDGDEPTLGSTEVEKQSDHKSSPQTTKIKFDSDSSDNYISDSGTAEVPNDTKFPTSILEKAQQMQHSRENEI